jgi:hypothetical protein
MNTHQLLFLPQIKPAESVRAYMLRAAHENMHPRIYSSEMQGLPLTLRFIDQLGSQNPAMAQTLARRMAPRVSKLSTLATALLGDDELPLWCLHGRSRQFCPVCLGNASWSRLEWEVKSNRACPMHRVMLAIDCPNCNRPLHWGRSELMHCYCGQALSRIETTEASRWDVMWAKLVQSATIVSRFGRQSPQLAGRKNVPTRLSKLLLMADVVKHVLLPSLEDIDTVGDDIRNLTVKILDDQAYSAYLWDSIFLHAARDPLELRWHLVPGRPKEAVVMVYGAMLAELALPHALRVLTTSYPKRVKAQAHGRFFDVRMHGVGAYQLHRREIDDDFDPFELVNVSEETPLELHQ